jgi:cytochrome d ubiquinol oxidase subunit II
VLKTDGPLQAKAIAWAKWGLAWVALGVALVSLVTPLASETVRAKWFSFPLIVFLSPLPICTALCGFLLYKNLGKSDWKPFAFAVAIYVLAFAGLAYSLFPYIVMDRMTIWEAAAHPSALSFVLIGTLIVVPVIGASTVYVYRIFGGKAKPGLYD